jgi:hypothetical protein
LIEARSYLDELSEVVESNVTVLLWAGDAEYVPSPHLPPSIFIPNISQLRMQLVRRTKRR